jgi:hypothetical protein
MNFRTNLFAAASLLAALLVPTAQTEAQTAQRSGYYSLNLGNDWMGGNVFAGASMYASRTLRDGISFRTNDYAYDILSMDASVRYLKQPRVVLAYGVMSARAQNTGTSPYEGRFNLMIRGITERNQRFTTAGTHYFWSYNRSFDLFPTDPRVSVSVYGYPVSVSGNLGVGCEANANCTLSGTGYARLGALGRVWGYGRVRAQAGWSWFGAGADFTATFANTRLTPSMTADARNPLQNGNVGPRSATVSGSVPLTIQAIALRLDVWVAVIRRFSVNLVNWSSNPITLLNILF